LEVETLVRDSAEQQVVALRHVFLKWAGTIWAEEMGRSDGEMGSCIDNVCVLAPSYRATISGGST